MCNPYEHPQIVVAVFNTDVAGSSRRFIEGRVVVDKSLNPEIVALGYINSNEFNLIYASQVLWPMSFISTRLT